MSRIFVSHINQDEVSDRFLGDLCSSLRARHMEVLIDIERLKPGSLWRKEIYTWLSICHAAVVLISPKALSDDSIWVPRETSLLMWRRALDPKLTIIPVLCPGVTLEAVEASNRFRDLQIREMQVVNLDAVKNPVEAILGSLDGIGTRGATPFDELVDVIVPLLRGLEPEHIEQAAQLAKNEPTGIGSIADPRRNLAFRMLSSDLEDLRPMLDHLFARSQASARADLGDVLSIVGANWVDLEAAQWIAKESAERMAGRPARAIALNASSLFAAEMYLQRASYRPPAARWPFIAVTGVSGNETSVEVLDEIDHALAAQMPLAPDPFQPDMSARRKRQLQHMQKTGIRLFFVMRLPPSATQLIPMLQDRYREANFFFLTGENEPDMDLYPADKLRLLSPPLAADVEDNALATFDTYRSAYQIPAR
ncbi:toll/interleukin-1 receptor domain-containing protein [Mesorhizobium sp. GbtcB19]|uniref:toll/interleukin-1 receptor domain-containing protein n=1 Tax=Mesorhizobium sp. GbtcB19 TaxID=2824764 RepID=UPI001C2F7DCA|nr:toll/interleukin-1 receptor domain-containing protein [Mesorhizobium sp. GbtcB19]